LETWALFPAPWTPLLPLHAELIAV
jgi:hypothetical protein